jgi:alkanesulfonate monooxygenase SsuD/methylene tetrahydromethanopterin reductase-like flavin-dependent oxidoreductase (luciferase family)
VKFSLSMPFFQGGQPNPWDEMFELAQLAEELGYDTVTIGHHHFQRSYPSDPLTLMAAIGARTERIRVGTGIFQLPLHHPLRVAEQVATIDQITGGRASLGVGLGWWPLEYETFAVDMHQRGALMEEMLQIMRLAWTQETISFDGRFFRFPELTVYPRPVQQPNPTLQVAGSAAASVDRAARLGDQWLCSPGETINAAVRWSSEYTAKRRALSKSPDWVLRRYVWIAPTRQEILDGVLPAYVGGLMEHMREAAEDSDNRALFARLDAGEHVSDEEIANDRILWGSPADVVQQILRYRALTGCDHIHVAFAMGLSGHGNSYMGDFASISAMVRLFGREVIPAFADTFR